MCAHASGFTTVLNACRAGWGPVYGKVHGSADPRLRLPKPGSGSTGRAGRVIVINCQLGQYTHDNKQINSGRWVPSRSAMTRTWLPQRRTSNNGTCPFFGSGDSCSLNLATLLPHLRLSPIACQRQERISCSRYARSRVSGHRCEARTDVLVLFRHSRSFGLHRIQHVLVALENSAR
jgi:hypothetical protein